jgi:hypothetical protein
LESLSRACQSVSQLNIVVYFPVQHEHVVRGWIYHGLGRGIREIEDGQAPMRKHGSPIISVRSRLPISRTVGTAMRHRIAHAPQRVPIAIVDQTDYAGYSAHA